MMENDSSDDSIVPESIPSSCPASPLLITGLHDIHKQKQVEDVQINPFDGHSDSENENELSQSLLKPRSAQVYRSPVFPPPSNKVPKFPDPEPDAQERRAVLQDGGNVKLIRDEDESKNDKEKINENFNSSDSDSTEIDEDRSYISDVIEYSGESPKSATVLLGHSQINNEDTKSLEARVQNIEGANTGVPDAKVLENDIPESCVPEMAVTEAEEPEIVAPEAAVPEDAVQTDQQISEATLKNKSWGDDEEQEALQDLERRLQKLRNGGEPSIHCKLMSIKMQLRLLNESFKEQRTASLKKLAKLQRESSKNKQHEKLVNISSKQKVLLKLVKIYRNISNESDIDINISNSSTPDGKRSCDGRQLSRHQSKPHQVESHEVEHSNQISAAGHQIRSIRRLPRRDHQRRAATDVDLNLVVQKLISAGLVTSTTVATSSICTGNSVAPTRGMTQETSKKGEHSSPDAELRNNDISKQILPTSGSTANPCQADANIAVPLTKERDDRATTMKLAIQAGASVCSSVLNQVTNSASVQSQKIVLTNHDYQITSQSSPCSSMLEKISLKNTNASKVITVLKPSKESENNVYLSSSLIANNNSRTGMTNQTLRNTSLNYAMSKSKGRGVTIQYQASPHPSTVTSNIVTLPSTSPISMSSSAVLSSDTAKTSSFSPTITTTSTTVAASQFSFNTANSLSSDASPAKMPADDQSFKDLLKNCRVSLIDDSELFPSRLYLPELFWTESFASIDLPSALINDIDNWDQCRNE